MRVQVQNESTGTLGEYKYASWRQFFSESGIKFKLAFDEEILISQTNLVLML